jgi:hypothetical protein
VAPYIRYVMCMATDIMFGNLCVLRSLILQIICCDGRFELATTGLFLTGLTSQGRKEFAATSQ